MISVYQNKTSNNVTFKDYAAMQKYIQLIQWGRGNPVGFIEKVLGITLMDYQKWLISESWTREYVVWACSRNAGKSFLVGAFMQARNLLFPKLLTQIISENWQTCNDTFKKMEDIAMNNIKTIVATNTVFIDELQKSKADSDGFTHDFKTGNKCELLNGSQINAIAGASRSARGRRSNVNVYDEAGFITPAVYDVTEPYMSQDASFKLGDNFDADIYPPEIPNIRLYIGSASDTGSYFYGKYREGTKQMMIGNDQYFVADISCEIPKAPTVNGNPVTPLLSQSEIDRKMRENEVAANREYYNIFDSFNLEDAVVTRADIFSHSRVYNPQTQWAGEGRKYIITYDPASKVDNAPVLVMEIRKDDNGRAIGRCQHMENLVVRYKDGSMRPMRVDEQVDRLRWLIWEYNGRDKSPAYDNMTVLIDAGAGGQASAIAQELVKDWTDERGVTHPGIYDEEDPNSVRWAETYPNAVKGVLHMVEPRKYRNAMFEAAKVLVPQGVITFPVDCPKNGILVFDDGMERKLSKAEEASLLQMTLMKEEIAAMVRIKSPTNGSITYQLPPDKRNKMHDDRNYCFVLACWWIKHLRDTDEFGDGVALDYSAFWGEASDPHRQSNDAPWLNALRGSEGLGGGRAHLSPFKGKSPFQPK